MKKKYLIFIPTGLNSPELEVLAANAQELINKKQEVNILVCGGGKNYRCSKNLFAIPGICSLCRDKRSKMINKLKGNFNLFETPKIPKPLNLKKFNNFKKLKNYNYKNLDNGLAVYSSYLDLTRDKDLKGFFSQNIISRLIHTTNTITEFYLKFLENKKFHELIMYNSRMNLYRPLFRLAEKFNIKLNNLESSHDGKKLIIHNFKHSLVNDYEKLPKIIKKHWNAKTKLNKDKLTNKFYASVRKFGSHMENPSGFLLGQKDNLLPKEWNKNIFNISYFVSSEDEYESVVMKKNTSEFKNQLDSILEICKIINKKLEFSLYVRMHPNLKNVKWSYVTDILKLKNKFNNVFIIDASSKISTHAIMQECDLALGLRSRALLEATYMKKPTLILGRSYWDSLGPFLKVSNKQKLKKIILSKKIKWLGTLCAKKYAYFWLTMGGTHKYVTGNYKWSKDKENVTPNFKFMSHSINLSKIQLIKYYTFKILEKILISFNYKLSKK